MIQSILNFIKNRGSFEKPVPRKRLETEFGLEKRDIEQVIEHLRVEFKHPIVASKKAKVSGYYLPKNDEERNAGLAPYKKTDFDIAEEPNSYYIC